MAGLALAPVGYLAIAACARFLAGPAALALPRLRAGVYFYRFTGDSLDESGRFGIR